MNPSFYIARRYLFAKKSHNVINVISAISAVGIAIGSAALVLILSVYNGFDRIIKDNLSDLDPDMLIVPSSGKYISNPDSLLETILQDAGVKCAGRVLEDSVFVSYGNRQGIALARGVEDSCESRSIEAHVIDGTYSLHNGDIPLAAIGSTLAYRMGIRPRFVEPLILHYPDRYAAISAVNPESSLRRCKVKPGSLFSISSDMDSRMIIVPIETMRELLGNEDIATGIEIRLKEPGERAEKAFARRISLGEEYSILNRYRQHPAMYKMMKYEKFAIFLILIFIVIIVAFNIFGSLSMLIMEKRDDMKELMALGAGDVQIRGIFVLEGWMTALVGLVAGIAAGTGLSLLQQHTGLVKMPGNYLVTSYPAVLQWTDVLATFIGVACIGFVISLATVSAQSSSGRSGTFGLM